MKRLVLLACLLPLTAWADGRFCVVTNYGQSCQYFDANHCRSEAARLGGVCVINPQPQQSSPDIAGGMMRGFAAGQAARNPAPPNTCPAQVVYRCGDGYSTYPQVGCTVISVTP